VDTPTAAKETVVKNWLTTEDDEGMLAAAADHIAFIEGEGGDATAGGGSYASDRRDADDSDGRGSDALAGKGNEGLKGSGRDEMDHEGRDESEGGRGDDWDMGASDNVADSNDE